LSDDVYSLGMRDSLLLYYSDNVLDKPLVRSPDNE